MKQLSYQDRIALLREKKIQHNKEHEGVQTTTRQAKNGNDASKIQKEETCNGTKHKRLEEHLPKKKIRVEEKKKNKENKLKTWKHQKKGLEDAKKDLKIQERFEGFGIKKKEKEKRNQEKQT